jgi:uncharacterized protein
VSNSSITTAVDHEFALQAQLPRLGRRQNATSGEPVESKLVLYQDRRTEIGIWEVTPGSFPASKDDVCELMQFIAGSATIVDANGATEVVPGTTMFTPDGWAGTWTVHEAVRKTYVLHRTKSRLHHGVRVALRRLRFGSRQAALSSRSSGSPASP